MENRMPLPTADKRARYYHKEGFNCAESIFLAFREQAAPELSADTVRIATAFGGGIGSSGCLCGALAGAVMILGLLKGRATPQAPRGEAYKLSGEFHNIFKGEFGATCCRVLRKNQKTADSGAAGCGELISRTDQLLREFINKKQLGRTLSD
jgi:C_GCAxxG_C_C family probable redox protein